MGEQALSEFLVLDLSQGVAGAFCGRLFAAYGAEVVKIEPPSGDPLRRYGPFVGGLPHPERGALHLFLNAGKKSVTLDLTTRSGASLFADLVLDADVAIETFVPGWLDSLGLGWPQLRALRPRLCLLSITPFGQTGPYADWKATSLTTFAAGGQMALTGDPQREPLRSAGHQAFYQAGLYAFVAALAVLNGIVLEDNGQHIDISVMECQAAALEHHLPDYAYPRPETAPRRRGSRLPPSASGRTLRDVLETTEAQRQGFFQRLEHPLAGVLTYPGAPFRLNGERPALGRAPLLGEHNAEVYGEWLGIRPLEQVQLRAAGVI